MTLPEALARPFRVLAIDPGMSGAVALAGCDQLAILRDFKTYPQIARAVAHFTSTGTVDHVLIEAVGARPGQGVVSMFNFGQATGTGLGAVAATWARREPERVSPLKWKNYYRLLLDIPRGQEVDSLTIAREYFPRFANFWTRKKDHNSADAFLIALWKLCQL